MDDVIDIGKAIETLIGRWKLIVVVMVVFVVASLIFVSRPPMEARVVIATVKESSSVSLGSAFETQPDSVLAKSTKLSERLKSFTQFIKNPRIAEIVIETLGDELPPALRTESRLMGTVSGGVISGSDSMEIVVSYPDTDIAAKIANAWAEEYVDQVNALYQDGSASMRDTVRKQVLEAEQTLAAAQLAVEQFLAEDERAEIDRLIAQNEARIQVLVETLDALSPEAQDYAKTIAVLVQERRDELDRLVVQIVEIESLLQRAEDMRAQVRIGGDIAAQSNVLSLLMLKTEVYSSERRADLDISVSSVADQISAVEMLGDLDALIETIETRLTLLELDRDVLIGMLMKGGDSLFTESEAFAPVNAEEDEGLGLARQAVEKDIASLFSENNDLRKRRKQQTFRFEQISSNLALAQQAYDAVVVRKTELDISAYATDTQVRLAVPAAIPDGQTVSRPKLARNGAVAGAVGLVVGCVLAWLVQAWVGYRQRTVGTV